MKNEYWKPEDREIFVITGKSDNKNKKRKTKVLGVPEKMTNRFQASLGRAVNEMKSAFERVFVKRIFMYRRDDGQMGACVVSNTRVK